MIRHRGLYLLMTNKTRVNRAVMHKRKDETVGQSQNSISKALAIYSPLENPIRTFKHVETSNNVNAKM